MRTVFLALASLLVLTPQVRAQTAASELINLWSDANTRCRGGHGDDPKTEAACEERERYAKRLDTLGFCYGREGDSGADMSWHRCERRSIRPERPRVSCVVSDPTPTPLNYRTSPNGGIMGRIENGRRVTIIDSAADGQGRAWVYIAQPDRTPLGWVFKRYVNCL